MGGNGSLEERISTVVNRLSPKQKSLARFVLDNKYFMSFAPAQQAALKTNTSPATVVRFAQAIGYQGFTAMQEALRAELPSYMTAVERMQKRLEDSPDGAEDPHQMFATDIRNIQRTASKLSKHDLDRAGEEILKADLIYVVGSGLSTGSAQFLTHSLRVIGFEVRPVLDAGLSMALDLAHIRPGSLLIAIGLWRYVRTTVKAISVAHLAGIPTIAITDSIISPLADQADIVFEVDTDSSGPNLSPTAVISLINTLVANLSAMAPEKTLESLRKVENAYQENDLVLVKRDESISN
jgi:DNA-binding MurR/RpiR family transcriptional regulator